MKTTRTKKTQKGDGLITGLLAGIIIPLIVKKIRGRK